MELTHKYNITKEAYKDCKFFKRPEACTDNKKTGFRCCFTCDDYKRCRKHCKYLS